MYNLLSVMEGEIARAGEAGGAPGYRACACGFALLKCQICPFSSVQMLLFLSHTVKYKPHSVVCHSPPSILLNHPLSYLAQGFKNILILYHISCCQTMYCMISFSSLSMLMGSWVHCIIPITSNQCAFLSLVWVFNIYTRSMAPTIVGTARA